MNRKEALSLNDVIAAYLEDLDAGKSPDPETFISDWPSHRDAFLRFVHQTKRLQTLAEEAIDDPSQFARRALLSSGDDVKVVGRFEIGRLIGRGGMSSVFEATDLEDGTVVAVKLLEAERLFDASNLTRFRREAQAVQLLDHPNIVPLLEYSTHEGLPYLVFPLVDGCTLRELIVAFGDQIGTNDHPISTETTEQDDGRIGFASRILDNPDHQNTCVQLGADAVAGDKNFSRKLVFELECFISSQRHGDRYQDIAELIAAAADALHSAHKNGIVHRDVKPSNMMIDRDGHLWLTDFGLASIDDAQTVLTQSGQVVGTPNYMSPEQAAGDSKVVDHRSDLFSLGATLYELATLQRPFNGDRLRVLLDISRGKLTPPSRIRKDVPKTLELIILKAMSLDPSDRYDTGSEMAEDLRRFACGQTPLARERRLIDRAFRWCVRNPRTSLTSFVGIAAICLLIVAVQYANARKLTEINSRLSKANTKLELTNEELLRSNSALDDSRTRLRRELYVADVSAAYQAYRENEIDSVLQLLSRQIPEQDDHAISEDLRGVEWWLLWNLSRPPETIEFSGHDGAARELAAVPGTRQWITVGDDGIIRHWAMESSQPVNQFSIGGTLDAIAVSPDGNKFVTSQNGAYSLNPLSVRSLLTGEVDASLTRHGHSVESAAFSPNGEFIATADRYHDLILHSAEGELLGRVATDSRNESLVFSGDGTQIFAIFREKIDGYIHQSLAAWSVPDLERQRIRNYGFIAEIIAMSSDGQRMAVAHSDGFVLANQSDFLATHEVENVRGRIRCIDLDSSGNQVVAGCDNGLIYIWKVEPNLQAELGPPKTIVSGEKRVTCVKFLDDETILTTSEDGSVRVFLMNQINEAFATFGLSTCAVAAPPERPDLLFLRGEFGGVERLSLSNLADYRQIARVDHDGKFHLATTADGQFVAVSSPGALVILSGDDGAVVQRIETGLRDKSRSQIQFDRKGLRLFELFADRLRVYRTENWTLEKQVILEHEGADAFAISPDEKTVLVVTRNTLFWLDATTLEVQRQYQGRLGEFKQACYAADGRLIAVGHSDGSVEVLDSEDLHRVWLLRGHDDQILDSLFLNDGQTLLTSARDDTIRFWDLVTGRELGVLPMREGCAEILHYCNEQQRLYGFVRGHPNHVWSAAR